ncbi:hypothetical protein LDENG_00168660, partial [Lucifuga dentata]
MAGKWYMVGIASNDEVFLNHKATLDMTMVTMTPTSEGDLGLSYSSLNVYGDCWKSESTFGKTDTPGHFTFISQVKNDNDMRIPDIVYDDYALFHITRTKEDGSLEFFSNLY